MANNFHLNATLYIHNFMCEIFYRDECRKRNVEKILPKNTHAAIKNTQLINLDIYQGFINLT